MAFLARDGRDSPLKYTNPVAASQPATARDGRDSPLKYTNAAAVQAAQIARDGRDSPLKYTTCLIYLTANMLGMAGIHRSSTLQLSNAYNEFS